MTTGTRLQDSNGNTFTIREISISNDPMIENGYTLKGAGGEKEVAESDLQFFKVVA